MGPIDQLQLLKNDISTELFIKTADENYLTARWCFINALDVDFLWLGTHALEKYMKAALLMNGQSAKSFTQGAKRQPFGHRIDLLFSALGKLANDLLDKSFTKPPIDSHWWEETPTAFIDRLYRNGNADNRYQIFGFARESCDLFKLDQLVFMVRRLCRTLDAYYTGKEVPELGSPTYRDMLAKHPKSWNLSRGHLETTAKGDRGEKLRRVFFDFNFPFCPTDFQHSDGVRGGASGKNPVLYRDVLQYLLSADPETRKIGIALCTWVLGNIQVPPGVKTQLTTELSKAVQYKP